MHAKRSNLLEPRRKLPRSCTLHWTSKTTRVQPRVATCYPNTSYTRNSAPNKASPHDLHPKRCRNPPRHPTLHPKPPGAPLVSLGETWFQTAWWVSHAARRQAPASASATPLSPGETNPTTKHHARPVATATVLGLYRLVACPASPDTNSWVLLQSSLCGLSPSDLHGSARRTPVTGNLLVFGTLE
ncbi:hypothetical protein DEO72_LG9g1401 [Vigna unguiculata]|uniref:Uncharacterized protein n=1 Tax=Vigna unguiculata TaxID=3917 RepID=A0A4D6N1Q9_VIGUN|nr:hypothetical protein DEO72_LG9g1401 [Vigna unguiculata]